MATKLKLALPESVPQSATKSTKLRLALPEMSKNRGGLAGGLEYLGASVLAGAGGVVEGTLDLIGGGIAALAGNKAYAEYLFENNVVGDWHKRIEDGYNPNGAIKFAGDVTTGLGQSATMLIPYVGVPLFFAGVGGQGVSGAVEKTGELGAKEWIYGGLSGAAEGALEYFVGQAGTALATVGKKAGKSITAKIASNVAKEWAASAAWKGVAKNMLTSASGEFVEEFLAEYIDTALLRITGVDKEATTDLRQAAYAGLVGFASGLAMGGITSGIDTSRSYITGRRVADAGNADTLIKTADKMITDAKIGKDSVVDNTIKQLRNSVEMYKKAENKGSDAALVYLGEVKSYMAAVETIHAVRSSAARLSTVNEAQATAYAKAMSYFDGNSEVSKNYTAQDWFNNKNDIRTRYAAMGWAGAFLSDSRAEVETAAFNQAIASDMAGRAVGKPVVSDIAGAEWDGSDATFYVGDANRGEGAPSEGDYLRIAKDAKGGYYMAVGNNAEGARGFAGRTENEVRELFNGYRDAVVEGRTKRAAEAEISARAAEARARADAMNAPESFATKSERRRAEKEAKEFEGQIGTTEADTSAVDTLRDEINAGSGRIAENRYTQAQTDAARKAVKDFDMLDADTKAKILRWIESTEGKGVDADVVSAVASIMRIREGLQVIYADTKEGVAGFHDEIKKADRNLIVLSSKNDLDLLRETIAHELGHEVENAEGFAEIKKAALKATKEADLKEWEEFYKKKFPNMTPEEARAEAEMKALGRRLATPQFLNRYANRSTLRRLIDAGKQLIEYLRADEAGKLAIDETNKLIEMMDRAIMGANVHESGKGAGKKYLFIGEKADTADKMKLATAQQLINNGADPEQVRRETGWFKGYDGKWRFEIDDSNMEYSRNGFNPDYLRYKELELKFISGTISDSELQELQNISQDIKNINFSRLDQFVKHKALFDAYPELKRVRVSFDSSMKENGAFYPDTFSIKINPNANDVKKTLLHEIQHAVQFTEGLTGGTGVKEVSPEVKNRVYILKEEQKKVSKELEEIYKEIGFKEYSESLWKKAWDMEIDPDTIESLEEQFLAEKSRKGLALYNYQKQVIEMVKEAMREESAPYEQYYKTAGEIEARDVANRADLTVEQRKNTRPDIDRTDVVFADKNTSYFSASENKEDIKRESKVTLQILEQNIEKVPNNDVFELESDGIVSEPKKSDFVNNIFVSQGGFAISKDLGRVELSHKGAKSTIFHGYGKNKLIASHAIKATIENGVIISAVNNYNNSGTDRYIVAAKGKINKNSAFMAVVIEGYPLNGGHKQFYLHEVLTKETAPHIMTATQNKADTVSGTVPNNSIPQTTEKSTPSAKKSYNLTESEAERAAQDAAEVEALLNAEDTGAAIRALRTEMWERETQVQAVAREAYEYRKEAIKKERKSEISRIEVMARDYNDYYYQYDSVNKLLKDFDYANKLKIYPLNDASFITYQELNAVRRNFARGDDSYLRSTLVQLVNGIIDMSSLKGASDAEVRDVKNNLYLTLRDFYESAAKQTPRGKSKERVEGLKDAIRDERAKYARYKDARDIERGAEIMRIETSAKDNNEQYWQYTDVRDTIRTLDKEASLTLNDINTVAFEVYKALNHIRGKIEGSELDSQIDALSEIVYDAYEQQNGKAPRSTATNDTRIHDALRALYNTKAKQTPRSKSKERVEYTRGQAKLHTLIDRLDRRRERLNKTRGSLAIKQWQKLVNAAHNIRPRFELSYDGLASFFEAFLEFANNAAPSAYTAANAAYKADSESEADAAAKLVAKYAEERQEGHNQLLDYIDPRLLENMIGIYEAMRPSESENADGKKASKIITPEMLQTASVAIQKMLSMDSRVDKIFRDGRWEDTRIKATEMLEGYSRGHRGRIGKSESKKGFKKLLESFVMAAVDPETAVHLVEGVFGDNTLSELVHAVKMSYERARADRDDWLRKFDEFQKSKDHKAWRKEWNEGEMTLKWTSITIDGKTVTQETTVTKQEAAQLYMTSKREQALAAIALGRLEFAETTGKGGRKLGVRKIGVSNETVDKLIGMEESEVNDIMLKLEVSAKASISELFNQFSETDKQYIKLIESFYNNTSKTVKKLCDTEYYGFTNIIEGYYVPISRGNTTVDIDLIASRVRSANDIPVSGFKFNISTVKGARSRLVIGSAQAILERHAQQLSLYKNMTLPLQNIQRLYNYKQAVSIDNVYSVREFIKDYVWDGMDVYLSDYFKDVQGMRTSYDTVSVMARTVKGGVAKSALGLNLASGIKQLSSFIQLFGVAKFNAVVRGIDPKLWKSSKEDLDKWSVLARNRHSNVEMYYAAGAAGKIGKVGDLLMTHLAIGDRSAQILFWAVAQQQAKLDGKGEIGTDSNKEYAADLVDKWTLIIQDTSSPTTKSALARHPQELVSAMTMFQSASMKLFSRGVSAIHELYLLHQMSKRSDLTSDEKAKVENAQSKVGKAAAALGGTILAGALFESIIGLIRDKIRGNDDEEEEDAKRIAIDTMLSVVGTVPVIGGFAESAFSGYDITEFYTDFLNDGVVAMRNTANVTAKIAAGEVVESEEILKSLKGVTVFAGQMMGIPVNNAMNIVKSTLNLTSPQAAYRYEAMFFEPSYSADLEKAIKSGKSDLAETIYRLSSKDIKTGKIADSLVVDEIIRLYGEGHNVIPRSAPTTYENDEGESVKVKAKQARDFEDIYSLADRAAAMVVTTPVYASLSSELQAKAIRVTYDIYHSRAKSEVFGAELSAMAALSYFEDYIDVPTLVAESAYIYGIKGTADAKRSEIVKAYISGYSPEAQAILLYAAGYRSEAVKEVISGLYGRLDADAQKSLKNIFDF